MAPLRRVLTRLRADRVYPTVFRALRRLHRRAMDGELWRPRRSTPERVEIAGGAHRDDWWQALRAELTRQGVPFTTGGSDRDWRPRLHLRAADVAALIVAIESVAAVVATDLGPATFVEGHQPPRPLAQLARRHDQSRFSRFDVWIAEHRTGSGAAGLYSVLELDLWDTPERTFRTEPYAVAPRHNRIATSMRWPTFDRITGADGVGEAMTSLAEVDLLPDLHDRQFPIDVVYTWVDDTDPTWLAAKDRHRGVELDAAGRESRARHAERFRNRDELRYSLRSLELFAPFVRHIYLVTMDQTPDWLDVDHPGLTVVSHRDIYADPSVLPTFNSSSIESQLHHIDGLAEHFLYFNDDVFLGRPCRWRDFFWANGATRFFPATHTVSAGLIDDDAEEYLLADRNAIRLIEAEFSQTAHLGMMHTPHPARRSVLYELEGKYAEAFETCAGNRFRSGDDLRPIAFFAHHYGFATGQAMPAGISNRYLALWKPQIAAQLAGVLRTRRYKTFCINDVGVTPDREAEVDRLVSEFLEAYFPVPSSYER